MKENYIPIAFVTDNDYVVPTCTAIQSLLESKADLTVYRIYIITVGLTEENVSMLNKFASDRTEIRIVTASADKINGLHDGRENSFCQATESALLKFELPALVPERRIIYLDGDILCFKDLTPLYHADLHGNLLGAVRDSGSIYSKRKIFTECPDYFNSGVMVMELDGMREADTAGSLFEIKRSMTRSELMDQDVFNIFFKDKVTLLDVQWNYLYINLMRAKDQGKTDICKFNEVFGTHYRSFTLACRDAAIVHFASKNKPWKDPEALMRDEWEDFFSRSPAGVISDYVVTEQIKWLIGERNALQKECSRLKKKQKELYKWRGECESIRKSISFKSGRFLTAPPRFIRDKLRSLQNARDHTPPECAVKKEDRRQRIIISLTSYGERLKTVQHSLDTIFRQTVKPDKIVLCVTQEDYALLPENLKALEKKGKIEVLTGENLRAHKKYFYTMQKYPDDIVITVDDDVLYRRDLVEKLYAAHRLFPDCVCAIRAHRIKLDEDGEPLPYTEWKLRSTEYLLQPRNDYLATGVGGVLYPPHLFDEETFNVELIKKLCYFADDIWLKIMELRSNIRVVLADIDPHLTYTEGTQEAGLFNTNVGENQNDVQLNALLDHYGREELICRILDNSR